MKIKCLLKTWTRNVTPIVLFSTIFFPLTSFGQDKCNRWWSQTILTNTYFNSPQITCDTIGSLYNQDHPNSRSRFALHTGDNDDTWECRRDGQYYAVIHRAERDSCCEATVFGKYSIFLDQWTMKVPLPGGGVLSLTERPARGRPFLESQQKAKIRQKNKANNGGQIMRSDLWDIPELADIDYPCNGQLVLNDPSNDCAPEIHHIVPRVDSKGCACGKNSFKNAVVITRKLNGELSNNCNDERLQRILAYFELQNNPVTPYSNKPKVTAKPTPGKPRSNPKR